MDLSTSVRLNWRRKRRDRRIFHPKFNTIFFSYSFSFFFSVSLGSGQFVTWNECCSVAGETHIKRQCSHVHMYNILEHYKMNNNNNNDNKEKKKTFYVEINEDEKIKLCWNETLNRIYHFFCVLLNITVSVSVASSSSSYISSILHYTIYFFFFSSFPKESINTWIFSIWSQFIEISKENNLFHFSTEARKVLGCWRNSTQVPSAFVKDARMHIWYIDCEKWVSVWWLIVRHLSLSDE